MPHRYLSYLAFLALALLSSCVYDNAADEQLPAPACVQPTTVSYVQHISPILQRNCLSCHSAVLLSGNVNLENLTEVQTRARSGQLLGVVRHDPGYQAMPQGGAKLSDCDIALLQKWVAEGAPAN